MFQIFLFDNELNAALLKLTLKCLVEAEIHFQKKYGFMIL